MSWTYELLANDFRRSITRGTRTSMTSGFTPSSVVLGGVAPFV
jgi:hypothetical protein